MKTEETKPFNPPAFPCADTLGNGERFTPLQEGMTLRDYFANSAMQGILSNSGVAGSYSTLSEMAYNIADALLKQREL